MRPSGLCRFLRSLRSTLAIAASLIAFGKWLLDVSRVLRRRGTLGGAGELALQSAEALVEQLESARVRPKPLDLPIDLVGPESEDHSSQNDATDQHSERDPNHVRTLLPGVGSDGGCSIGADRLGKPARREHRHLSTGA